MLLGDGPTVADGLTVADGPLVGAGLLVGAGPLVGAGAAGGSAGGELTADSGRVGASPGIGSVALAAELGNRVMTGSTAGGLCFATDGAGVEAGEAAAWTCRPGWKSGPAGALFAAAAGPPAESVVPAR